LNDKPRQEFGHDRSVCDCTVCVTNCQHMPGYLIPSDLERMMPSGQPDQVMKWAEKNLLASPGALAIYNGRPIRIGTLVPASKPDGSCINLDADNRCSIHAVAPFGCAFFDCRMSHRQADALSEQALLIIMRLPPECWYVRIHSHLTELGLVSPSPEEKRARMAAVPEIPIQAFNYKTKTFCETFDIETVEDSIVREYIPQDEFTQRTYIRERERGSDKYTAMCTALKGHA
jgi:hypothetical protein